VYGNTAVRVLLYKDALVVMEIQQAPSLWVAVAVVRVALEQLLEQLTVAQAAQV
jgi:hypothetical protein